MDKMREQPMTDSLYHCPWCSASVNGGDNPCPHCRAAIAWHAHCPDCQALLEKVAACGSVSYFCPSCNSLKSRRTIHWALDAGAL